MKKRQLEFAIVQWSVDRDIKNLIESAIESALVSPDFLTALAGIINNTIKSYPKFKNKIIFINSLINRTLDDNEDAKNFLRSKINY